MHVAQTLTVREVAAVKDELVLASADHDVDRFIDTAPISSIDSLGVQLLIAWTKENPTRRLLVTPGSPFAEVIQHLGLWAGDEDALTAPFQIEVKE
ncbi:hypothetical protein B2G71_08345 [Novosphingobium sp. PC22D]|uniref:hypothetical protein n=1 Tax=Novosphingobium sp. PC22D TaxID=1962403 RepID=UPI000BF06326|nr:hypothetical protein [Novosphingobium sp. PC22D]PEQ13424.1 hypothetical protein B2G71_08345 [Novosphingobium sp. PC22D]